MTMNVIDYGHLVFRQLPQPASGRFVDENEKCHDLWRVVIYEFVKDLQSKHNETRDYAFNLFNDAEHEHRRNLCDLAGWSEDWLLTIYRSGVLEKFVAQRNTQQVSHRKQK